MSIQWPPPNEPLDFESCEVVRYDMDNGDWLEIQYSDDGTYLVDSNRFLDEKVCQDADELLELLGWGRDVIQK